MPFSRRQLLVRGGATALAALALPLSRLADARGILVDPLLDEIVGRALSAAKKAGATYADVRIVRRRSEDVTAREDRVRGVTASESYGLGVRVLAKGAWGFAASSRVEGAEAERVALLAAQIAATNARIVKRPVALSVEKPSVDVWRTPLIKDPFRIAPADKAELLLALNAEVLKVPGVKYCTASSQLHGEWKLFASTDGSYVEQEITRVDLQHSATAVDSGSGRFVSRSSELAPRQTGWEYVEESRILEGARRIGEDAVEKLKAPRVEPGRKDLILAPSNLWLTIHESVGHPTELDRALGYEANFAGTSFATLDKLGKLKFAAPHVSLYADKTTPGALATCGYDDEGVKTQRWDLIKDGLFVGYQTTREQAALMGEKTSRGTSYAQDFKSFPFQRMPNVSLAPGKKDLSLNDLIAATDDGVLVSGNGSFSIDQQRYNFQFGGQTFHAIKGGKVAHALRDVAYQANTLEFWTSCDLLGGPSSWWLGGSMNDGKGEPQQVNAVGHGCPPARFSRIRILDTGDRKGG